LYRDECDRPVCSATCSIRRIFMLAPVTLCDVITRSILMEDISYGSL